MLVKILRLDISTVTPFLPLISPQFQSVLGNLSSSHIALGAVHSGKPIGLILVEMRPHCQAANLLFLLVIEGERRRGIGRELLRNAEDILQKSGYDSLYVEFLGETFENKEASFLSSCGFVSPQPGIYIYYGPLKSLVGEKWFITSKLNRPFSFDSLETITQEERDILQQGCEDWYPSNLFPFAEEESVDKNLSLILRNGNEIVGWVIVEPFDRDTALFKSMFVKKPYQRMGRGISLFVQAMRRIFQFSHYQNGVLFIESSNREMVKFAQRRLLRPSVHEQILWRSMKEIGKK